VAGDGRWALLDAIDAAAGVGELHSAFEEDRRTWLAQRARLRELDQRRNARPALEGKLADVKAKLGALARSHHWDVLKAHQTAPVVVKEDVSVIRLIEGAVFKEFEGPRSKRAFCPPASVPA